MILVIRQPEFELTNSDFGVQYFRHYTTENLLWYTGENILKIDRIVLFLRHSNNSFKQNDSFSLQIFNDITLLLCLE